MTRSVSQEGPAPRDFVDDDATDGRSVDDARVDDSAPAEVADKPRRKRGRPAIVTAEMIRETALEMGVATITMTSVAARLGVNHATLYRYVSSRDDLVKHALDLALERSEYPAAGNDWREFLYDTAIATQRMCENHPGVATELAGGTFSPNMLQRGTEVMVSLVHLGFSPTNAVLALDLVIDLVIDHCRRTEQMDGRVPSPSMPSREAFATTWPQSDPDAAPEFQDTVQAGREAIDTDPSQWLDRKLTIALAGIAQEIAPR
ncbi:TetR/AcrR family transcriptional regulator [Hoyosella rhizosphaerae]|uniref:HTH tetR-type domain-containing protein n=1 Tax=Hoyosella rhizosphaerae TaxID=1755582 RepID=A0A916U8B9_9ACTN|nr:TetR/AcrR family transcriptional regulator [Hoyosella rhizosphaerae]MBN4927492.1 TetR/AcrR family transcriptional regulator [Hoyosella rhizosphaerae]GGC64045.1 hypothetical protein GCM10011410_15640 [Hoyosella rhizosphaerae]